MFSKHQFFSACTWIPSHQKPQHHLHLKPVEILQSCWGPLRIGIQPFWPHTAGQAVQKFRFACGTWEERQHFELAQRSPSGTKDIQLPHCGKHIRCTNLAAFYCTLSNACICPSLYGSQHAAPYSRIGHTSVV